MRSTRIVRLLIMMLWVLSPTDGFAQPASSIRGFSIVLAIGYPSDAPPPPPTSPAPPLEAPAAVQKALNDIKDFLPYKTYRVADVQWIASTRKDSPIMGRLVDDLGRRYEVVMNTRPPLNNRLDIAFTLDQVPREVQSHLLLTRFDMDVGETVVVGTSRVGTENRGLIVLLTAVPVK